MERFLNALAVIITIIIFASLGWCFGIIIFAPLGWCFGWLIVISKGFVILYLVAPLSAGWALDRILDRNL